MNFSELVARAFAVCDKYYPPAPVKPVDPKPLEQVLALAKAA